MEMNSKYNDRPKHLLVTKDQQKQRRKDEQMGKLFCLFIFFASKFMIQLLWLKDTSVAKA